MRLHGVREAAEEGVALLGVDGPAWVAIVPPHVDSPWLQLAHLHAASWSAGSTCQRLRLWQKRNKLGKRELTGSLPVIECRLLQCMHIFLSTAPGKNPIVPRAPALQPAEPVHFGRSSALFAGGSEAAAKSIVWSSAGPHKCNPCLPPSRPAEL